MPNTVLVFDWYYLDEAGRQGLRAKNVKFIDAVNPQRFPMLTALGRHGVDRRGQWKGLWNEKRKELIVHVWQKDDKRYTTFSNAYARTASKVIGGVYLWPVTTLKCFKLVTFITNRLKTGCGHTGMVAKNIWEKEKSTACLPLLAFCKIPLMLIVPIWK